MPIIGIYGPAISQIAVRRPAIAHAPPRRRSGERATRAADAVARVDARGRARDRASLRARQERHPAGRVAVLRALREGDQRAEDSSATPSSWRTTTRRRKSSIASPISSATRCSSRVEATKVKADIIVQCGVHFMAETSKILNPDKTVLIPDSRAGCSLAASITGEDVRLLRERFPGVPVVTYVNTSADVKAESDICCTSSNAVQVVESLGADTVIFLPDQYLAKYVASQDQGEDHRLEGRLRGARALHRRRASRLSRSRPVGADHRASGVPARRDRGSRLHRLDRAHDRLGAQATSRSAS